MGFVANEKSRISTTSTKTCIITLIIRCIQLSWFGNDKQPSCTVMYLYGNSQHLTGPMYLFNLAWGRVFGGVLFNWWVLFPFTYNLNGLSFLCSLYYVWFSFWGPTIVLSASALKEVVWKSLISTAVGHWHTERHNRGPIFPVFQTWAMQYFRQWRG